MQSDLLCIQTYCVVRLTVRSDLLCSQNYCAFRSTVHSDLLYSQTYCTIRPTVWSDLLCSQIWGEEEAWREAGKREGHDGEMLGRCHVYSLPPVKYGAMHIRHVHGGGMTWEWRKGDGTWVGTGPGKGHCMRHMYEKIIAKPTVFYASWNTNKIDLKLSEDFILSFYLKRKPRGLITTVQHLAEAGAWLAGPSSWTWPSSLLFCPCRSGPVSVAMALISLLTDWKESGKLLTSTLWAGIQDCGRRIRCRQLYDP